jgi:thiosulfate dehydrogenase
MAKARSNKGIGKFFLGVAVTIVLFVIGFFLYLKFGPHPVAVADAPFPFERQVVKAPLKARIKRQMQHAPFGISEDVFEEGAHIYQAQCAMCHGTPGHDSLLAKHMYPAAPQLWKKHGPHGVVGVSDDEAGSTYWIVANGIRLTGMPSFTHVLSDREMWEVSLLLKNADQELPDPVNQILNGPAARKP